MPKGIYNRDKSKPRRRERFFHDEKWLRKEYLLKRRSVPDIAKELKLRFSSLMWWFTKYKIPLREKFEASIEKRREMAKEGKLFRHKITREYLSREFVEKKKTVNQICCDVGVSSDCIRKRLLRYGFVMRPRDVLGKRGKRTSTETRRFTRETLERYGYKCVICGYDRFVNCCHLKRRANGGEDVADNGTILCPNHHAEYDYGILSSEEVIEKTKSIRHSPTLQGIGENK